jgi:hypothetical protein
MTENATQTHTPGPWRSEGQYVIGEGNQLIAVAGRSTEPEIRIAHEANARLIAAAPDLLAACELMESVYRQNVVNPGEPSSVLEALQAAIAKARGQ